LGNMLILAAEIPFAIVVLAVIALMTVRYNIKDDALQVSIFGRAIRKVPLSEITSVEYLRAEDVRHWSMFYRHGMVVVHAGSDKTLAFSHSDAEGFAARLREIVSKKTRPSKISPR
jgi:uncharacterized protein with von Willebrand factor type A (vWA) domain